MLIIDKILPHIPSTNMQVSKEYLVTLFDFKAVTDTEYFIELKNSNNSVAILNATDFPNEQSIYFQVSGIEKLWENIKNYLPKIMV